MSKPFNLWHALALLPLLIAVLGTICLILVGGLLKTEPRLLGVLSFAFAEGLTLLAGLGGVAYLLNPMKTRAAKGVLALNIALFFSAALAGLLVFMSF